MKKRGKKTAAAVAPAPAVTPRARTARSRQRQRLIDACISALHIHGPSRTTVEKVVAIAKMSPGIVRFYFDSKAAMLVASLQFLSDEFEEQVLVPVARLTARPVAALELLVDLYLDPDIASARKVSVWYAFWGEASSRQEYYDICGQKDESFTVLVRELVGSLIGQSGLRQLDPDGIALGLTGVLEILWQDFAFQTEDNIDRSAAKRRCMAYLRSVFPGEFPHDSAGIAALENRATGSARIAGWAYGSAGLLVQELRQIFDGAWMIAGHAAQLPVAGDFLTTDTGVERVLVIRDGTGRLRALRNSCPVQPHQLVRDAHGRLDGIRCQTHEREFHIDGRGRDGRGHQGAGRGTLATGQPASLGELGLRNVGGLLLVRSARGTDGAEPAISASSAAPGWAECRPLRRRADCDVRADWKVVVERWLGGADAGTDSAMNSSGGWSERMYLHLLRKAGLGAPTMRAATGALGTQPQHRFVEPNVLLEWRPDGLSILQVIPTAAGRCRLQGFDLTRCANDRVAEALQYLAGRINGRARRGAVELAESIQDGIVHFGYPAGSPSAASPAAEHFWQSLTARVPAMTLSQAPAGL